MSRTTPSIDRNGTPRQGRGLDILGSALEFVDPVEALEGDGSNDHLVLIYESREERFATVVPFVRRGLERGERCLYIAGEDDEERLLAELREAGVDTDAAVESGALTIRSAEGVYRRDGGFDPDRMLGFLEEAIETVDGDAYDGLRVVGESTWFLKDGTTSEELLEYEARVNRLLDGEDCVGLCQYDRGRFPAELLVDVIRTHPHLIYDGTLCRNFYYTPPGEFLDADRHEREVDRMMGTLLDHTEARAERREHERCLQAAYEITSDPERSFDGKVRALLELGRRRFGLEVGCLTHLPSWDGEFNIEAVVGGAALDDFPSVQPGPGRYCRRTIETDGPVCETDVRDLGWEDDPVFETYGLTSYVGVQVSVGPEPYGTLWFGGTEPREAAFTEAETTFLELMAQWVSYELERKEHNRYQRTLYEIAASSDLTFEEKLHRLLAFGRDRFDVDVGFLARIEDDSFEVVDAVGSHEVLRPGATDSLERTYCRQVIESSAPIRVVDAPAEGWEDDPAYERYDLDCYLGARVDVGDELYGTLCFADTAPRERRFTEAETTFLELMTQWVRYELERERHEAQLAALNEMSRDLMDAGTSREVAERSVDHAERALDLPLTAVLLYDEAAGALSTVARTLRMADEFPTSSLCEPGSGTLWEAFVANESRVVGDVEVPGASADFAEALAVPLGRQGLFVTATGAAGGLDPAERDFAEATARTVEAACARADRERLLREREETLAEQNEALERLNRINDIIRDIDRALVRASTREEIEAVVCERLAGAGPYELAWIGDHDAIAGEVTPLEWAGAERGYLDGTAVGVDGDGPIARAVETREPQVVNSVLDDRTVGSWRKAALDRGHHATIALPLVYDDTLYGVLSVSAGQPNVFDGLERTVLVELSDTIAYAMNAAESKKALVSDEVTELELSIPRSELRSTALPEGARELSLEKVVPRSSGGFHGFFTLRGGSGDIEELAAALPVAEPSLVSEYEDDEHGEPVRLFEGELVDGSVPRTVLEHGGRPREFSVAGEATTVVDLAVDADVREFVDMIRTKYPGSEVVAQRTRERPRRTFAELRATLDDELTDRQLEALQLSYFAGYFDQPRARTSREIAETMGITQPTFNAHLRTAHRKLCRLLFEPEASEA